VRRPAPTSGGMGHGCGLPQSAAVAIAYGGDRMRVARSGRRLFAGKTSCINDEYYWGPTTPAAASSLGVVFSKSLSATEPDQE
jgi:hypothetical protein